MNRIISILIVLLAITNCNTALSQATADSLKTVTIKVSGITCNGDMTVIKKKLINRDGIDEVSFTEAKKGEVTFTVKYHSSITNEKQIREWIEAAPSCDNPDLYPYKTKTIKADNPK